MVSLQVDNCLLDGVGKTHLVELFLLLLLVNYRPYPFEYLGGTDSASLSDLLPLVKSLYTYFASCLFGVLATLDYAIKMVQDHIQSLRVGFPEHGPAKSDAAGTVPVEGLKQTQVPKEEGFILSGNLILFVLGWHEF